MVSKLTEFEQQERREYAQRETEIADPIDHERLDGGGVRRRTVVPETDQQIRGEAHPFPAEIHLHQVVGGDQHQHEEREQAQIAHEPGNAVVVVHVTDGIHMHHRRYAVHHQQHDRGQGIHPERPGNLQRAGVDPGEQIDGARVAAERDVDKHEHRQHRRDQQRAARDPLGGLVDAGLSLRTVRRHERQSAGDDRGQKRQKDNQNRHFRPLSPSSC